MQVVKDTFDTSLIGPFHNRRLNLWRQTAEGTASHISCREKQCISPADQDEEVVMPRHNQHI
jgi:hypothetical protein